MHRSGSAAGTRSDPKTVDASYPLVEFAIPADPAFVRVARLVSGDMAERAGFSVDELDDVRLAVDELCAILISAGGSKLQLRMQARDGALLIDGRSPGAHTQVGPSDLSEILLRALVDSCTFGTQDRETSFVMSKQARDIA